MEMPGSTTLAVPVKRSRSHSVKSFVFISAHPSPLAVLHLHPSRPHSPRQLVHAIPAADIQSPCSTTATGAASRRGPQLAKTASPALGARQNFCESFPAGPSSFQHVRR